MQHLNHHHHKADLTQRVQEVCGVPHRCSASRYAACLSQDTAFERMVSASWWPDDAPLPASLSATSRSLLAAFTSLLKLWAACTASTKAIRCFVMLSACRPLFAEKFLEA